MTSLRRDFLPTDARHEMDVAAIDAWWRFRRVRRSRRPAGCWSWPRRTRLSRAWWAGSICRPRMSRRSCERFATSPKLVGVRHIVQAEADDRFLLRPAFCRGISLLRGVRPHLRHSHLSQTSPVAAEFVVAVPPAAFRSGSSGKTRDSHRARFGPGRQGSVSLPNFRTCTARCRAW